jgi:hypothetical protein
MFLAVFKAKMLGMYRYRYVVEDYLLTIARHLEGIELANVL